MHWDEAAQSRDEARDRWLISQGVIVIRIPASEVYRDPDRVADGILLQAQAVIAADGSRRRRAPSTIRSSADGPPPAASRGR
jgi:very-short-patch-repair endonuclease